MKFIYADSLDYVDPLYDVAADRSLPAREPYWDDQFTHEYLGYAPYDGILVSRGIVGGVGQPGKYSRAQAMRFRLVGAEKFLRYSADRFPGRLLFGDCGAFSYHKKKKPPYEPDETVSWYVDAGFTHACSVDHVIFDFDATVRGLDGGSSEARRRFDITLENASEFLKEARRQRATFEPLGVVQGWSPDSMAEAARRLVAMGYRYLAIGGMVPLKTDQVHQALTAIREKIPANIALHLLGFAKADRIHEFHHYGVASFDTTSPLLRAFKDGKKNYYWLKPEGGLEYYTAIRIPQAIENSRLMRGARSGLVQQEDLQSAETAALQQLRAFDKANVTLDDALNAILAYADLMAKALHGSSEDWLARDVRRLAAPYRHTLASRVWQKCSCPVCRDVGIEVIIFRSSNRNKRRGMHNIATFARHLERVGSETTNATQLQDNDLFRSTCPAM